MHLPSGTPALLAIAIGPSHTLTLAHHAKKKTLLSLHLLLPSSPKGLCHIHHTCAAAIIPETALCPKQIHFYSGQM